MAEQQTAGKPGRPNIPRGMDLLNHPGLNKGTAFTEEERTQFGLHGLLPPHIETLEEQAIRAYEAYQRKDEDLGRHIYLRALQDTNEVLFYRLLLDHIEEMTPIVYTPVVALGAILGAVKVTGKSLKDQQIVMLGAGSAGIGVADGLRAAMKGEGLRKMRRTTTFGLSTKTAFCIRGEKT